MKAAGLDVVKFGIGRRATESELNAASMAYSKALDDKFMREAEGV